MGSPAIPPQPTSTLTPPPDPARIAIVGDSGTLTTEGFWFLYRLFRAAQAAEGTAVLEAFDSVSNPAIQAAADATLLQQTDSQGQDQSALIALEKRFQFAESGPVVTKPDLDDVRAEMNARISESPVTKADLDDVRTASLQEILPKLAGSFPSMTGYFHDLAVLIAMGDATPKLPKILTGTHAQRLVTPADSNSLFFETDRTVIYIALPTAKWQYAGGVYTDVVANIPNDLVFSDKGFLFASSDYFHTHYWTGLTFVFAPGDPGSAYIVGGEALSPNGGLWQICNGSSVNVCSGNGALTLTPVPDLTGNIFLQGSSGFSGSRDAATAPTWGFGAKTDDEATHTHVVPDQNTADESAHVHSVTATGTTVNNGAGAPSFVVASVDTPSGPGTAHHHDVPSQSTFSGTAHHHNLSNANATINPPSDTNGGLPLRMHLTWWFRR